MNNKLLKSWFVTGYRAEFREFVDKEMVGLLKNLNSPTLYSQEDRGYIYKSSVLGALFTCIGYIEYLCVDNKKPKPWFVRKKIDTVLDINQFKEQVDETVKWFSNAPPNQEYARLVYSQTIVAFLTTMEIK